MIRRFYIEYEKCPKEGDLDVKTTQQIHILKNITIQWVREDTTNNNTLIIIYFKTLAQILYYYFIIVKANVT